MTATVSQRERLDELAHDAGLEIALAIPAERPTLVHRFLQKLATTIQTAASRKTS